MMQTYYIFCSTLLPTRLTSNIKQKSVTYEQVHVGYKEVQKSMRLWCLEELLNQKLVAYPSITIDIISSTGNTIHH